MKATLEFLNLVVGISVIYLGLAYFGLWLIDNTVFACVIG